MPKTITSTLLSVILAVTVGSLNGCDNQQKAQEQQDAKFRHDVEQQKMRSKAYPGNGSNNHYIP